MPLHRHVSPPTSRPTIPLLVHRWEGGPIPSLTQREREVLALLAGGPSNRQIAEALGISERTARPD